MEKDYSYIYVIVSNDNEKALNSLIRKGEKKNVQYDLGSTLRKNYINRLEKSHPDGIKIDEAAKIFSEEYNLLWEKI